MENKNFRVFDPDGNPVVIDGEDVFTWGNERGLDSEDRGQLKAQLAIDALWENVPTLDETRELIGDKASLRLSDKKHLWEKMMSILSCTETGRNEDDELVRKMSEDRMPEQARLGWKSIILQVTEAAELPLDLFHFLIVGQVLLWPAQIRRSDELAQVPPLFGGKYDEYGMLQPYRSQESTTADGQLMDSFVGEIRTHIGQGPTKTEYGALSKNEDEKYVAVAREYETLLKEHPDWTKTRAKEELRQVLDGKFGFGGDYSVRTMERWINKGQTILEEGLVL